MAFHIENVDGYIVRYLVVWLFHANSSIRYDVHSIVAQCKRLNLSHKWRNWSAVNFLDLWRVDYHASNFTTFVSCFLHPNELFLGRGPD